MDESAAGGNFAIAVRVYYEDTDAGGVVYYANYLKFMERAREQEGVIFAVRALTVEFLKPARFNDLLRTTVSVRRRGGASLSFEQQIERDGVALVRARLKVACLDGGSFAPRAIPASVVSRLNGAGVH